MTDRLREAALAGLLAVLAAPALALAQAPSPPDAIDRLSQDQVVAVLGLTARGADGKEVGRIVDVLVDKDGKPRAAVVDVGGFMGMGSRKVAVDWAALRFSLGKQAVVTLAIPLDQIKSAPAYDPAKPVRAIEGPEPPLAAPATKP